MTFYAVGSKDRSAADRIEVGDRFVLYTTTNKLARTTQRSGFIGSFTATGKLYEDSSRIFGFRSYQLRIPWKPNALLLDDPVELKPLVADLSFIKNKSNYGMYLRTNLRELLSKDFATIERMIQARAKAS
jgi:predicted RNA-binding protein